MSDEDATDIFDTALSALFAVPPIAFSTASPSAPHVYQPPTGPPVTLYLPHPPAALHATLQANHVWLAAVYLADEIARGHIDVAGLRLAELGAAASLPSIAACRAGARVVSTDFAVDEVLDVIKRNFAINCHGRAWAVTGHEWGTDPTNVLAQLGGGPFDALILADTLWVTEAHAALLDSVQRLAPGGVAHVAAGLHTGRGPVERFMAAATRRGMRVTMKTEVRWKVGGGWEPYAMPASGFEEERGVVVYYTLHVS